MTAQQRSLDADLRSGEVATANAESRLEAGRGRRAIELLPVGDLAHELAALMRRETTPPLLDSAEAAAVLNVPASWIAAEARAGRIPHVRLGRYVRFNRDELIAWCERRSVGPRARDGRRRS